MKNLTITVSRSCIGGGGDGSCVYQNEYPIGMGMAMIYPHVVLVLAKRNSEVKRNEDGT